MKKAFDRIPLASPRDPDDVARSEAAIALLTGRTPRGRVKADALEPFRRSMPRSARKLISIRLDEWMLELAKAVARRHGLGYQHVIRMWIEQGLRRSVEGRS